MDNLIRHAKMTFLAQLNPYNSVKKVFPNAINAFTKEKHVCYIGIKDVKQIPYELYRKLQEKGNYILHTLDHSAYGGRAVDLKLCNPITGNYMSGSSSGTAINVLTGINDIGIGTDGGGSVLAPAISLNIYSFISPLIEQSHMEKYRKLSTDAISFTPSIGFMTRDWKEMRRIISDVVILDRRHENDHKMTAFSDREEKRENIIPTKKISFPDVLGKREMLIEFLTEILPKCDFLITHEGPVDINGFGDSIFGHFDERTESIQRNANKGLIRVVNMANATAVTIPTGELGCAWVLICESNTKKIQIMLDEAKKLITDADDLLTRYFLNLDMYFEKGFGQ